MNARLALLLSLLLVTLWYRGSIIHTIFIDPGLVGNEKVGMIVAMGDESIVVRGVVETSGDGAPTAAARAGVEPGDEILWVVGPDGEGGRVRSYFDWGERLVALDPGEVWGLVVRRAGPDETETLLELPMPPVDETPFTARLALLRFAFHIWLPLLGIVAGTFIGVSRPRDDHALLASVMFLCFSSIFYERIFALPPVTREVALFHRVTAVHLTPYLFLHLFLIFPRRSPIDSKLPTLKWALLALTFAGWVYSLVNSFAGHAKWTIVETFADLFGRSGLAAVLGGLGMPLMAGLVLLGTSSLVLSYVNEESLLGRRRIGLLLAGVVGLIPLFVMAVLEWIGRSPSLWFYLVMVVTLGFFPLSFIYVVVRHRVFGIRLILRRGLQYVLVSRGVLALEAVAVFGALYFGLGRTFEHFFNDIDSSVVAISSALVAVVLVMGIRRLNKSLLPVIDRAFFRDAYNARQILIDLSRAARQLTARPEHLLEVVASKITHSLHPHNVSILLRDRPWPFSCPSGARPYDAGAREEPGVGRFFLCLAQNEDGAPLRAGVSDEPLVIDADLRVFFEALRDKEPQALELHPEAHRVATERLGLGPLHEELDAQLVVPAVSSGEVLALIVLGRKRSEEPYTGEDRELLLAVAEQIALSLDYAQLVGETAERKRLEREIEIATDVQRQLFPQKLPAMRTLRYNGVCRPAQGIGGDYFDFVRISRSKLGIALGDVSGKGISAALLMAGLQAALRSHAPRQGQALAELVAEVNRLMHASMDDNRFATFFYCLYDDESRRLTYVNAGHNPPILVRNGEYRQDDACRPVGAAGRERTHDEARESRNAGDAAGGTGNGEASASASGGAGLGDGDDRGNGDLLVEQLGPDNTVLGMFADVAFEQKQCRLEPGDVLLIYSDGVTEAMDVDGRDFGAERLAELVRQHHHLDADALRDRVLEELAVFAGEAPQHDDMTLIVAKVT